MKRTSRTSGTWMTTPTTSSIGKRDSTTSRNSYSNQRPSNNPISHAQLKSCRAYHEIDSLHAGRSSHGHRPVRLDEFSRVPARAVPRRQRRSPAHEPLGTHATGSRDTHLQSTLLTLT